MLYVLCLIWPRVCVCACVCVCELVMKPKSNWVSISCPCIGELCAHSVAPLAATHVWCTAECCHIFVQRVCHFRVIAYTCRWPCVHRMPFSQAVSIVEHCAFIAVKIVIKFNATLHKRSSKCKFNAACVSIRMCHMAAASAAAVLSLSLSSVCLCSLAQLAQRNISICSALEPRYIGQPSRRAPHLSSGYCC